MSYSASEWAAGAKKAIGARQVGCYRLADVLTPEQLEAVEPFMRETFTEMWAVARLDNLNGNPQQQARFALRMAVWDAPWAPGNSRFSMQSVEEGREIERLLFARARSEGKEIVPGPARSR